MRISIVTACDNAEKTLARTLDSVRLFLLLADAPAEVGK